MKKLLAVLAVVMLAAFAAPAFAATNPFMDVPASHWAYDAVAQLAARGVISGYPDGTFKGPQPATRYEIASIIARSLAYVDADKASKADVEMMRRLIVEFSDELSALGVTVDEFDGRLGQLESDLGGWRLSGVFEFNAKFGKNRLQTASANGDIDFQLDKYRILIDRRINETTNFHARLGKLDGTDGLRTGEYEVSWDYYYITTKLGYDIELTAGRFAWDWENEYGLRTDNDSYMGDITRQGIGLRRDWGIANLALLVERHNDDGNGNNFTWRGAPGGSVVWRGEEFTRIAASVNVNFNEKFGGGIVGYFDIADNSPVWAATPEFSGDLDRNTFGVYARFRFHPSVELKGIYYSQNLGNGWLFNPATGVGVADDNPNAWKAILDINQDLLKFTSLWLEYAQIDNSFYLDNGGAYENFDSGPLANIQGINDNGTSKVLLVVANQKWNDKWDSWVRYNWVDYDNVGVQDFTQYGAGVGYQLNPAVHFELGYDYAEYGDNTDDNLVRFQTIVNF